MSKNNSSCGKLNVLRAIADVGTHVHFVGVGGAGMSSLCALSHHFGISISGEDRAMGEYIPTLALPQGSIRVGQHNPLPDRTTLLVYSLAISEGDEALIEAEKRGLKVVSRAEYMSALIEPYRVKIAVSGTHGKSTVTSMLHSIFKCAGCAPTTLSGAPLSGEGRNIHIGSLDYLIFESCEYKDSFLYFTPDIAVFLNLEHDHPDYFKSEEQLCESFLAAMKNTPRPLVYQGDGKLREIAKKLDTPPIFVGEDSEKCTYSYQKAGEGTARLFYKGHPLGEITVPLLGGFNVINAAISASTALECGVSFATVREALAGFCGVPRRLEHIGDYKGRAVYYDYAHHPTEIRAGIEALRSKGGEVTVIFVPHTYSRTAVLWDGFVGALGLADHLILRGIDAVREEALDGVSAERLARETGGDYLASVDDLLPLLDKTVGCIAIMGAADTSEIKNALFPEKKLDNLHPRG